MSDGWDVVSEYADTVAYVVEEEIKLKAEIENLRKDLSARLQELHHIRNESLVWAMRCRHECPACDAMYDVIKGTDQP